MKMDLIKNCMTVLYYLAPLFLVLWIMGIITKYLEKKKIIESEEKEEREIDNTNNNNETKDDDDDDDEYPYVKTFLLTKNEWKFYKSLKPIADKYHLHIIAKVRLADLVSVKKGLTNSTYFKALSKIQSKHIDFVITRPDNLAVLCAIELDDSTHEKIERQKRDYFVENICKKVDLPLIRTNGAEGIEDKICQTLKINKK